MRRAILSAFLMLLAGCQVRPDAKHVLVIRPKSDGGDYFAKYPGPYMPREVAQRPINEVIHKHLTPEEIEAYVRTKVPHSLGAQITTHGGERLLKVGDAYFVAVEVDDLETPHANDCPYWLVVLVSSEGTPVEIESNPFTTCPIWSF